MRRKEQILTRLDTTLTKLRILERMAGGQVPSDQSSVNQALASIRSNVEEVTRLIELERNEMVSPSP